MKKYYEDENTHGWSNFLLSILMMACIASMFICFKDNIPLEISIILSAFLSIFVFTFLYLILSNIINARKNRETVALFMNKGKKVSGRIIEEESKRDIDYKDTIFKRAEYYGRNSRISKLYRYTVLKVEYEYNGKKHVTTTPPINFSTDYLNDKKVDVFIYQDNCYVGNYKVDYNKKKKEEKEKYDYKIKSIIFVVVYMLLFTFVALLAFNNIIEGDLLKYILFTLIVSFFIIATILFIIYNKSLIADVKKALKKDKKE